MSQGILLVLFWWICIGAIGLVTWPVSKRFFSTFHDQGYILSKGLGLVLVGFINWFLCSLHILPFSVVSILVSILIVGAASWYLKPTPLADFRTFLKEQKKLVLTVEAVFLLAFIGFAIVRMCNPEIAQTEKMPDFAFLTSITNSTHFPPADPWFAGGTINYFYYGHYMVALLTKLTMVPTEYGYNLGVAVIFALTLLAAIGISYNLIRKVWYGVFGGLFVAFIGNLDCFIQLLNHISEIATGQKKFYPYTWYNWWMSSRVIVREGIDVTINEFPFWSYILGDLHAHMNVVPISLVVMAVILELFRSAGDGFDVVGKGKDRWFKLSVAAIALGAIPCANTWDVPTYFALVPIAILLGRQFALPSNGLLAASGGDSISVAQVVFSPVTDLKKRIFRQIPANWSRVILSWASISILIVGALALYLPFHLYFHPVGTEGPRLLGAEQRTLIDDFITIYGFFFYCIAPMVIAMLYPKFKNLNDRIRPLAGVGSVFLFLALLLVFDRFMIAFCVMLLVATLAVPLKKNDPDVKDKFFVLALFIMALLILLGCEFIYLKDAYGGSLERQNTVFKFYYQAWIFCGLATGYSVYWMRTKSKGIVASIWEPGFRILLMGVVMFPVIASSVKTNYFKPVTSPTQFAKPTLDGMHYMSWQHKGDYAAIKWLRENASVEERVLEAAGPAFSHYGRITAATGMETILGWANHENIWRDGTWKVVGARKNEVKKVYTSNRPQEIRRILDKYDITYVFYGKLEREQYKNSSSENFNFMEKVMEVMDNDQKMTYLYRYKSSDSR